MLQCANKGPLGTFDFGIDCWRDRGPCAFQLPKLRENAGVAKFVLLSAYKQMLLIVHG